MKRSSRRPPTSRLVRVLEVADTASTTMDLHLEMLDLRGGVLGDGWVIDVVDLPSAAQLPPHGAI